MASASNGPVDLAIVGGGQSCKALLLKVAEALARRQRFALPRSIAIYEKGDRFGAGQAWGPADTLEGHRSSQPSGYPRARYGLEQSEVFGRLVALLRQQGVAVAESIATEVTRLSRLGDRWCLHHAQGPDAEARTVVLATGHWVDAPVGESPVLDCPAWATRPTMAALRDIDAAELRIGILGSYLAGVDLALAAAWSLGDFAREGDRLVFVPTRPFVVELMSRGGRLPWVWPRHVAPWRLRHFTAERLREGSVRAASGEFIPLSWMAARLCDELRVASAAGDDPLRFLTGRYDALASEGTLAVHARTTIRALASSAQGAGPRWLRVMNASLPVFSEHFSLLSAEDHLRFQQECRSGYFGMAMPMAAQTAEQLAALERAGCLRVTAATAERWQRLEGGVVRGHLRLPGDRPRVQDFHLVLNGRNPGTRIDRHPQALIQSLLAEGLVRPASKAYRAQERSPMQVEGMHVDTGSCATFARPAESAAPRLYAMGPPLLGLFADAQSLGHLARDADRIMSDCAGAWS